MSSNGPESTNADKKDAETTQSGGNRATEGTTAPETQQPEGQAAAGTTPPGQEAANTTPETSQAAAGSSQTTSQQQGAGAGTPAAGQTQAASTTSPTGEAAGTASGAQEGGSATPQTQQPAGGTATQTQQPAGTAPQSSQTAGTSSDTQQAASTPPSTQQAASTAPAAQTAAGGQSQAPAAQPSTTQSGGGSSTGSESKKQDGKKRESKSRESKPSESKSSGEAQGLLERSREFRKNYLTPSGGWLNDVVVGISDATRLSDLFVLAFVFVAAWVTLRMTEKGVSMILGAGFDLIIPLQHYMSENKNVQARHAGHFDTYYSVFLVGTAIEVACLFMVRSNLFTLVVCLKTTACTAAWLGSGPGGSSSSRASSSGKSKSGSGGSQPSKDQMKAWSKKLQSAGFKDKDAIGALVKQVAGTPDARREDRLKRWCDEAKKDPAKREQREKAAAAAAKESKAKKAAAGK